MRSWIYPEDPLIFPILLDTVTDDQSVFFRVNEKQTYMEFQSVDPYRDELLQTYEEHSEEDVLQALESSWKAFFDWKKVPIDERGTLMKAVGDRLMEDQDGHAEMISREMGKPLPEARAEIEKCAWVCDFYAENADDFLADELIDTGYGETFVSHDPLGPVLAIMPWNFPFWQVFRFAVPALMAGNTAILKHAPNVFGCAERILELFQEAGFPEGTFESLRIHHDRVSGLLADDRVRAATLTGSERAGSSMASIAGKQIKKTVLELGGSNPFIVFPDADLDKAVQTGLKGRLQNSGQSCIAAKRFIVHEKVYDDFLSAFNEGMKKVKMGDPMEAGTDIGPLARRDLADQLQDQVRRSEKAGARILSGGKQQGTFHEPTVMTDVEPGMAVFDEETFGPVAPVIKARDEEEAFDLAGRTRYGLGVSLFTGDLEKGRHYIDRVEDGAFFLNSVVKSDPRLPFGGTKASGYGRELSREGIREFVNRKTVYVGQ